MNKILIIPYTWQLGSTHTLLYVGEYLRGHDFKVVVAGSGKFLSVAKDLGFEIVDLPEIPIDIYREHTDRGNFNYLSENEIEEFVDAELEVIRRYSIDIVFDTLRPTTYISSRIAKIPKVSLTYAPLTKVYALPRPIPETHFLYHTKIAPPLCHIISKHAQHVLNIINSIAARPYRKILKRNNLLTKKNIDYEDLTRGDLAFMFDIPTFAPINKKSLLANKYIYIGTPLLNFPVQEPSWLSKVRRLKREGRTVVYVSMGSSTDSAIYNRILESLLKYKSNKSRHLVIVTDFCGQYCNIKGDQLFSGKFLPADEVLDLADIVVSHGGRGTLYRLIKYGVPFIGIPNQGEQEWNIKRAEELGFAEFVSKISFSQEMFEGALKHILEYREDYVSNMKPLQKEMDIYKPGEIVENVILDILRNQDL